MPSNFPQNAQDWPSADAPGRAYEFHKDKMNKYGASARLKQENILLERLRNENLEKIPATVQHQVQHQTTREFPSAEKQEDRHHLQLHMDNDFNSSVFPESVQNQNMLNEENEENIHAQQSGDDDQMLDGLASGDDSQKDSGDIKLDGPHRNNASDSKGKKGHRASNSLHQRQAEIIDEGQLLLARREDEEAQDNDSAQLGEEEGEDCLSGGKSSPRARVPPIDDLAQRLQEQLKGDSEGKPRTPKIQQVHLNTAVLEQRQPSDGPE